MYVFEVADYEFSVRFYEYKMADPIWLPCCYKISTKLVAVPIEYIFIHAKKNVTTEKNDEMENLKEERKECAKT